MSQWMRSRRRVARRRDCFGKGEHLMLARAHTSHESFDESSSGRPSTALCSPFTHIWPIRRCKNPVFAWNKHWVRFVTGERVGLEGKDVR
jgi:hypothetical protein